MSKAKEWKVNVGVLPFNSSYNSKFLWSIQHKLYKVFFTVYFSTITMVERLSKCGLIAQQVRAHA